MSGSESKINLESIHKRSNPDVVLDIIRRQDSEIAEERLKVSVKKASEHLADEEPPQTPVDSSALDIETASRLLRF